MGLFSNIKEGIGSFVGLGRHDILYKKLYKEYYRVLETMPGKKTHEQFKSLENKALIAAFLTWHDSKYKARPIHETIIELKPFLESDDAGRQQALFIYIDAIDGGDIDAYGIFTGFINNSIDMNYECAIEGISNDCYWVRFIRKNLMQKILNKYPDLKREKEKMDALKEKYYK